MTNLTRVGPLLVEMICREDTPVGGFDQSGMALDLRAADHFR